MEDKVRHPLLLATRPRYWVPPITDLGKAINLGIEFNRHGIVVRGLGRIGKTEALILLSRTMDWRSYSMLWHVLLAGEPNQPSEAYFFNSLKLSANLKVREQTQSIFSVHHVANYLCEEAARIGAEVIVLAIDDANRLRHEDYTHLVTLDNHISKLGFRLFVVLMVQSDADQSNVPTFSKEYYPSHITGRFTADEYLYTGLAGPAQIKEALRAFGDQQFLGKSFLEEFAGPAVANGWHIDLHSEDLLSAAVTLRAKNSLDPDEPFPMMCFDTSTYYLVVRVAGENPKFERFTETDLLKAVEISGLIAIERSRKPKDIK